jgi:hypothetical protein
MLDAVSNVILLVGFLPALAFTIDYVIVRPLRHYTPWWESGIGWMFAMLGIAISTIGGFVLSSLLLGDYTGRHLIRFLSYSSFTVATTLLLVVYFAERNSPEPVLFRKKERLNHDRRR